MRLASRIPAVLAMVAGCALDQEPAPPLPEPFYVLPAPVASTADNDRDRIFSLDGHIVVVLNGKIAEIAEDGTEVSGGFPDGSYLLDCRDGWAAFTVGGDMARRSALGVETSSAAQPQNVWKTVVAAPDGAFYQKDSGKIWEWTTGAPHLLPWTVDTTVDLIAADSTYLYGDDHGVIVRFARADGARFVLVERSQYDYESLVMFALGGGRIIYDVGWKLFAYDLATGTKSQLGTVPAETYAGFAVDETHAFWSGYRFADGERTHALGASHGGHVSYVRIVGDRVAWVTTTDPGLYVVDL